MKFDILIQPWRNFTCLQLETRRAKLQWTHKFSLCFIVSDKVYRRELEANNCKWSLKNRAPTINSNNL